MGCTNTTEYVIPNIPDPMGPPVDPLTSSGNIIDVISQDPHIHYYQKKIEQVYMPIRMQKLSSQEKQKDKKNILMIEKFATADKEEHRKYVETVNSALRQNTASVTNIMGYMLDQMADMRQGKNASDKFRNDTYAALKCFIYLYTGHYSYKKINSQLRRNQYEKVSQVIAVVQKQLQDYNRQKFSRKLKANLKFGKILNLYRGIPKPDKTIQKAQKLYWKAFTSTSLDTTVAARFGRYTFVISLQNTNPHPYMIVPEELSQFKQQEIILFPYFYFECTNVQNFTSGARYQCKQINAESQAKQKEK